MDFFDNVVNKSNAIIKERLNNPFGGSKQAPTDQQDQQQSSGGNQEQGQNDTTNLVDNQAITATTTPQQSNTKQHSQDSTNGGGCGGGDESDRNSQFAAIAADAEAVAQKAAKGAKTFGTFLFSMANKAGQTVSQTAKQVKQAVESTSMLADFTREQQDFIREHGGSLQAGELPWANQEDETKSAYIREQILSLSQDKRNFVRAPPSDSNFKFDPQACYPIALSLLKEDPNLNRMRYELVPKLVNEDTFWCNYFYRVSMLKQMSEKNAGDAKKGWASSRSSSGEGPDELGDAQNEEPLRPVYDTATKTTSVTSTTSGKPPHHHHQHQQQQEQSQEIFGSVGNTTDKENVTETTTTTATDAQYQSNELESSESRKLMAEADDLKSKLRELNIGSLDDGQDDDEKWEEELQRDLQEFELVSGGDVDALDEEALDSEIMQLTK